jgi:23S rRNA (uridine2552-2'-O)-methyltransferase
MANSKRGGGSVPGATGGRRQLKVRLKSAKERTPSSQRWLERQLNDPYVAAAKRQGYRSRAAFKLIEIDDKHRMLKPGRRVVDLGAAPGGWAQVAAERVRSVEGKGQVVAIDLLEMEPVAGVAFRRLDFMDPTAPEQLKAMLREGHADVVLSDMAAQGTGHTRTDHLRIMALAEAAVEFACEVLVPGGAFLCKVLQGGTERELLERLRRAFTTVKHIKPPASRAGSAELYVIAVGVRGADRETP